MPFDIKPEYAKRPAERVIQALLDAGHELSISDPELVGNDVAIIRSVADFQAWWYALDDLSVTVQVAREDGTTMTSFVWFLHQYTFDEPMLDDIADYGVSLDGIISPIIEEYDRC